jgi:TPR repeat protein
LYVVPANFEYSILGTMRLYQLAFLIMLTWGTASAAKHSPFAPSQDLLARAQQGDAVAQVRIAKPYYEEHNYDEAEKWFRRAAEQGNAEAEDYLGTLYFTGRGVPQNYTEAARWFHMAADKDIEHAQRQLAEMYAHGLGVQRDHAESEKWSEKVMAKMPPDPTRAAHALRVL